MKRFLKVFAFSFLIVSFAAVSASLAAEKKVFKVGMECASAPYNWSQSNREEGTARIAGSKEYAYGYDVIIAQKIADSMGAELEVHKIEWDGLPPAVATGKVDAAIAAMSITEKRKTTVDFSDPYYYAHVVPLVRKDSPQGKAQSIADLRGSRATSQLNTMWYDKIDQIPDVKKLPAMADIPSLIVALASGKCDVLVVDIPSAKAAAYANPELMMLELAPGKGFQTNREDVELGIAIRKGNTELAAEINKVLSKLTDEDRAAFMEEAVRRQPLMQ